MSVWCIFRGAKAVRGGGVCCDAAAPPQCVFGLEAAATGFQLGMRIPCTIVCKSSADDVGRIGFVREPADGESPHRWRMELAGAGSAMIDIHVPAAVHRPITVSVYHNEYFETLGGLYNHNTSFRT